MIWVKSKMHLLVRVFLFTIIISSTIMGGCGIFTDDDNLETPYPLPEFIASAEIEKIWSRKVGGGADELYVKLTPIISDNKIYVAEHEGEIAAVDVANGKIIWEKDIDLNITSGLGFGSGLVIFGTDNGELLSLSAENGDKIWGVNLSSEILAPPSEKNGKVIVRTVDGKIFALDADTGEVLWSYKRSVPSLTLRGTSTPIINDDMVISGFDSGRLIALKLDTGKPIWESRIAIPSGRGELERIVDIDIKPLVVGDMIYIATFQTNVKALSVETGVELWEKKIPSYSELNADDDNLYIIDNNSHIWALELKSGESVWVQEQLRARRLSGAAIINNKIIVGDLEGYLHFIDKDIGYFIAREEVSDSAILVTPIVHNNIIYAYANDGVLSAYKISNIPDEIN